MKCSARKHAELSGFGVTWELLQHPGQTYKPLPNTLSFLHPIFLSHQSNLHIIMSNGSSLLKSRLAWIEYSFLGASATFQGLPSSWSYTRRRGFNTLLVPPPSPACEVKFPCIASPSYSLKCKFLRVHSHITCPISDWGKRFSSFS